MFLPRSRGCLSGRYTRGHSSLVHDAARGKKEECGALIICGHHTLGCRLVERDALRVACVYLMCIDQQMTTTMTVLTVTSC
ncbi:hypothetical protein X777_00520 [Ooceraea biroi]|uniref:Uncharacterized protein n=1 Tax=Ooceraea biroi TaxID=2015173 RepID=A0A026WTN1_OOCBI|nr:hypothetical protein X777_00520 [Ooceraea biroi]